ncbi:ATP-dependent helicase wrn-1-like [Diadema antillarum]|uniref:ATP-dependent helicase wrn-1-like n=1 Tax=Diadema antillarum TaxID=105358 RepID=UPI003A8C78FE
MSALKKLTLDFSDDEIEESIKYAASKIGFMDGFRDEQRTCIKSFLLGHDLFVALPTGFGKSAIFQVAPLCVDFLRGLRDCNSSKAVAVVVMPLKSLVTDQMSRAEEFGIIAADLSAGLTDTIRESISAGKYSILFASPECLQEDDTPEIFQLLRDQVCGFFIDESHCVTKWGNSSADSKAFRGAYGKLGEIRVRMKASIPTVAMTATATCDTRKRIADSLGLRNFVLVKESPEKLNIKHTVYHTKSRDVDDMFNWLVQELRDGGGDTTRTIIYCQSRKVVTEIYESFITQLPQSHRKHVSMFHSTTPKDIQQYIIDSFSEADGEVRVLIATIAYGMGIDVCGVTRAVICGHPSDLDDYVQMSGRIGRDGSPSVAATIKYPGDSVGRKTSSGMWDFLGGDRVVWTIFFRSTNWWSVAVSGWAHCVGACMCMRVYWWGMRTIKIVQYLD